MISNREKYHFADFTTENYRKLLKLAKKNYSFCLFDQPSSGKSVIWRHDVDFSMHRALKLARVEKEEGIKSIYFVLLHSEFYNLLEREVSDCLMEILELGHAVGLHFDSHYYNVKSEAEMEKFLMVEAKILEDVFGVRVNSFSFHITNPFTSSCEKKSYAGLINVYSYYFKKEYAYCSDSNGYWRYRRLEDVLAKAEDQKLQVLTHPELWQDEAMSPKDRVWRCIDERARKTREWYNRVLVENGRLNIGE